MNDRKTDALAERLKWLRASRRAAQHGIRITPPPGYAALPSLHDTIPAPTVPGSPVVYRLTNEEPGRPSAASLRHNSGSNAASVPTQQRRQLARTDRQQTALKAGRKTRKQLRMQAAGAILRARSTRR